MAFEESENQFYAPYWEWEDFLNGMYKATKGGDFEQSKIMFTNPDIFYEAMKQVLTKWPIATKVNFTNKRQNRRAWIGQAASCIYADLTEEETCEVWSGLTEYQRITANKTADKIIREWEQENNEGYIQTRIFSY